MGEFYFKNYFLSEEEIEKNKQNISGNTEICGNDTLKPNLKNKISLFVNKTSDYYDYYFKLSENKITQISRKRKFPDEDKNMTKYNTERLKLLGSHIEVLFCNDNLFSRKGFGIGYRKIIFKLFSRRFYESRKYFKRNDIILYKNVL